jgi:hypothetical protein
MTRKEERRNDNQEIRNDDEENGEGRNDDQQERGNDAEVGGNQERKPRGGEGETTRGSRGNEEEKQGNKEKEEGNEEEEKGNEGEKRRQGGPYDGGRRFEHDDQRRSANPATRRVETTTAQRRGWEPYDEVKNHPIEQSWPSRLCFFLFKLHCMYLGTNPRRASHPPWDNIFVLLEPTCDSYVCK